MCSDVTDFAFYVWFGWVDRNVNKSNEVEQKHIKQCINCDDDLNLCFSG